jgi:hypothetical protein
LCIGALALLFAVAARRLSMPEGIERAWLELRAPRAAAASMPVAEAPPAPATAVGALQRLRSRKAPALPSDQPPPSVPRFSRPPPLPPGTAAPVPGTAARTATTQAAHGSSAPPPARQPTAAEILLARRRGRKP